MRHSDKVLLAAGAALLLAGSVAAEGLPEPLQQSKLNALLAAEGPEAAFVFAFDAGDELTEASFDAARGIGAHVGEGRRFTRFPRADLAGATEWTQHVPLREGGPNATSCIACHNAPAANGAGDVALNVVVDPAHTGDPAKYLERNTLPLFALAAPQRLAEEMSAELFAQRAALSEAACAAGSATGALSAKGVSFGVLAVTRTAADPCRVSVDTSGVDGLDPDLVIKPFGWKGTHATIRDFTRGAAHNELGMQAVELVGETDGDHDGVTGELLVGDLTALVVYMAALERPVSTLELADAGVIELAPEARARITRGEGLFGQIGCAACHVPSMELADPVFSEPSVTPGYFDTTFPAGVSPASFGLTPDKAISFDMTWDQPNNRIETNGGEVRLGAFPKTAAGGARIAWYSDFKRHDMGPGLADPDDPRGIGAAMWPTRSLAGVGSTGPWLHDGRATTLAEAILAHGGAGGASRDAFATLAPAEQDAVIAFLESLVIHVTEEEEH